MERMCVIALAAAALLTLIALPLDVWAIADWRQNAIDTAGMVTSTFCVAAWLFAGMTILYAKTNHLLTAAIRKTRRQSVAADALRRLALDQPTEPLGVPPRIRRIK